LQNATVGQIGIVDINAWSVIQLYDFTIGEFNVVYEQAGADEVVSLDYDSADLDDYASLTLDRNSASQGSEVHLVITDNQLNIDPTAEDIVIFYVSEGRAASQDYGVSFTNSTLANTVSGEGYVGADYNAWSNSFDDNGKLIIVNHTNSVHSVLVNQYLQMMLLLTTQQQTITSSSMKVVKTVVSSTILMMTMMQT